MANKLILYSHLIKLSPYSINDYIILLDLILDLIHLLKI